MTTLKVTDSYGFEIKGWSFGTFKVTQVGLGIPTRKISGWQINSPDGVERFCEGNWQQFVPYAIRVVENYGYKTNLS